MISSEAVPLGLVLAGGLARRMGGGDKARIRIGGTTILERVLARLGPQCARDHPQRQRRSGALCRHRPAGRGRRRAGFRRPARRHPGRPRLGGGACARPSPTSSACRATARSCRPIWSRACRRRARRRARRSPARARASGGIRWSGCGRCALRDDLRQALADEGLHKIELWTARHGVAIADWPATPVDPFFNVNTPEDVAEAERIAAQHRDALTA